MNEAFNPAWIAVGMGLLNAAFLAGVQFGAIGPLRKTVDKLGDTIEAAAQTREAQAEKFGEMRTEIATLSRELNRLRDKLEAKEG